MGTDAVNSRFERAEPALRPTLRGTQAMVASGHHLATGAAVRLLERGGNAVDAGVATVLAAAVVEQSSFGLGGEAPVAAAQSRALGYFAWACLVGFLGPAEAARARAVAEKFSCRAVDRLPRQRHPAHRAVLGVDAELEILAARAASTVARLDTLSLRELARTLLEV